MRYSLFGSNCYSEKMEQKVERSNSLFEKLFIRIVFMIQFHITKFKVYVTKLLASINKMISRK